MALFLGVQNKNKNCMYQRENNKSLYEKKKNEKKNPLPSVVALRIVVVHCSGGRAAAARLVCLVSESIECRKTRYLPALIILR